MDVTQQLPESNDILSHSGKSTDSENVFKCEICRRQFRSKNKFKCHSCGHTKGTSLQDEVCLHFPSEENNLENPFSLRVDKKHQCGKCQKGFTKQRSLNGHFPQCTGKKLHHCGICNKSFFKNSELNDHLHNRKGDCPYECDVCQKIFCQKIHFIEHCVTHIGETPYQCSLCEKTFRTKCRFKAHSSIHKKEIE